MSSALNSSQKKTLSKLLRSARGERTLREFSKDVGVSYSAINSWENEIGDPKISSFELIAEVLGYSFVMLYCIVKHQYPNIQELKELSANLSREEKINLASYLLQESQKKEVLYGDLI